MTVLCQPQCQAAPTTWRSDIPRAQTCSAPHRSSQDKGTSTGHALGSEAIGPDEAIVLCSEETTSDSDSSGNSYECWSEEEEFTTRPSQWESPFDVPYSFTPTITDYPRTLTDRYAHLYYDSYFDEQYGVIAYDIELDWLQPPDPLEWRSEDLEVSAMRKRKSARSRPQYRKNLRKADPFVRRRGNPAKRPTKRKMRKYVRTATDKHEAAIRKNRTFVSNLQLSPCHDFAASHEVFKESLTETHPFAFEKVRQFVKSKIMGCSRLSATTAFLHPESFCVRRFAELCEEHGDDFVLLWHGTNPRGVRGILRKGLIVGGTFGVPVRHGRALGAGVYLGANFNTASTYANGGAVFLVAFFKNTGAQFTHCPSRDITVVSTPHSLAPIILVGKGKVVSHFTYTNVFEWPAESLGPEPCGKVTDLTSVVTTSRMKFAGRFCSMATVLRLFAGQR
jgi:hypothetical protein